MMMMLYTVDVLMLICCNLSSSSVLQRDLMRDAANILVFLSFAFANVVVFVGVSEQMKYIVEEEKTKEKQQKQK